MTFALIGFAGTNAQADEEAADRIAKSPLRIPKHAGVYVVAHRGAHHGIPENSLPAYQKAIELGADSRPRQDDQATRNGA